MLSDRRRNGRGDKVGGDTLVVDYSDCEWVAMIARRDDLVEWWQGYAESDCFSSTPAADCNLLITNGKGDAPSGRGLMGGKYAVVELGPCTSGGDWNYSGTRDSNDSEYRYAMNAVHEMGHNLHMEHHDGRVDENYDGTADETPMMNLYGDDAIDNNWSLNCDSSVPNSQPSDWYTQNHFCTCEEQRSYL